MRFRHRPSAVLLMTLATLTLGACSKGAAPAPAPAPGTATAATAAATVAAQPKVVDLTDSKEVETLCLAALAAYRDKNLPRLAELGPPSAKEKLIFLEPRNPNYEILLGDDTWRMKSLKAWNGKLSQIERGLEDVARCDYFEDATSKYAIEVRKDNGRWAFFDLVQTPKSAPANPGAAVAPTPTPAPAP